MLGHVVHAFALLLVVLAGQRAGPTATRNVALVTAGFLTTYAAGRQAATTMAGMCSGLLQAQAAMELQQEEDYQLGLLANAAGTLQKREQYYHQFLAWCAKRHPPVYPGAIEVEHLRLYGLTLARSGQKDPSGILGQVILRCIRPTRGPDGTTQHALAPAWGYEMLELVAARRDVQRAATCDEAHKAKPAILRPAVTQLLYPNQFTQMCFALQTGLRFSSIYEIHGEDVKRRVHNGQEVLCVTVGKDKVRKFQGRDIMIGCNCFMQTGERMVLRDAVPLQKPPHLGGGLAVRPPGEKQQINRTWCLLHNPEHARLDLPAAKQMWGNGSETVTRASENRALLRRLGWTQQSPRRAAALYARWAMTSDAARFDLTSWMMDRGWTKLATYNRYCADYEKWKDSIPDAVCPVLSSIRPYALQGDERPPKGHLYSRDVAPLLKDSIDDCLTENDSELEEQCPGITKRLREMKKAGGAKDGFDGGGHGDAVTAKQEKQASRTEAGAGPANGAGEEAAGRETAGKSTGSFPTCLQKPGSEGGRQRCGPGEKTGSKAASETTGGAEET